MVDDLDSRTRALVGIAAAVAGHCQSCFAYHHGNAVELGVTPAEIEAVVELARGIRSSGDRHMDELVVRRMSRAHTTAETG